MTCREDMAFLVDVSRRCRRARQPKRLRKSVIRHLKDRVHIGRELAVEIETIRLMNMRVGDIGNEIESHLPMGAASIATEEEDRGKHTTIAIVRRLLHRFHLVGRHRLRLGNAATALDRHHATIDLLHRLPEGLHRNLRHLRCLLK
jgi:hypothetical protein